MTTYQIARMGDFLNHRSEYFRIDDFQEYKRARVQLHGRGIVQRDTITGSKLRTKKQQSARAGEFLVAEIDAKVGGFGIVPPDLDGAIVSSHYFLFEIDESVCLNEWLDYFVRGGLLTEQVNARGSTNYASIRPHHVLDFEIPLPPLAEQRRILGRIEELAEKVEEARRLRETAVREADALWNSTLSQVFEPVGTQEKILAEVCEDIIDNLHSTPEYDGNEFPCLRSQDIGYGTINYSTALRTSEAEFIHRTRRGEPKAGDIIYVREGSIGKCGIVDGSHRFSLGQRVMMFRPNQAVISSKYMLYQLMSSPVHNEQILNSKTGTTSHHVNIKRLKKIVLKIPSPAEQTEVVAYLDDLRLQLDKVQRLQESTQKEIEALLPSVLDKAFNGEL